MTTDGTLTVSLAPLRFGADGWCCGTASVTSIAGRRLLILPFAAPVGASRGKRFTVVVGAEGVARQRTVLSVRGRAALALPDDLDLSVTEVTVRLRPLRRMRQRRVPSDLTALLREGGLSFDAVPEPERTQLIHMINESTTPAVRAARIEAAVQVVRVWSRHAVPG